MSDLSDLEAQFHVSEEAEEAEETTYAPFAAVEELRDKYDVFEETGEETGKCLWCERARNILFGTAAITIGLFFVAIGIDLATNGKLSGLFSPALGGIDDDGTDTE